MNYKFSFQHIISGLCLLFLFIGIALNFVIFFRPLYYFDVSYLDIEKYSGFSKEIIYKNYNILIDYCSPFFSGDLVFSDITVSEPALSHFAKVKQVFMLFHVLALGSLFYLIFTWKKAKKQNNFSWLVTGSITALVLPILIGFCCIFFWEKSFEIFHKIFFPGDYWLFDWNLDQIIRILPDTFFLQCAIIIIISIIIFSIVTLLYGLKKCKEIFVSI